MPYLMTNKYDCGPCAIASATGLPLEKIKRAMRWADYNDSRDNLNDSPANAFLALKTLGIPYRVVTCGQILAGECKPGKTIILIHGQGLVASWLQQHWVVLQSATPNRITVALGDGTFPGWDLAGFQAAYSRGGPTATAYEVGVDGAKNTRWNWWGKLMSWVFGK